MESRSSISPIQTKPVEIAFFDRGPVDEARLITAGHWSAYWYNGAIYGAEIARGIDVLRLKAGEQLSKNEIDAANAVRLPDFNAQQQPRVDLAGEGGCRRCLSGPVDAKQWHRTGEGVRRQSGALDKSDHAQLSTLAG